MRIPTTILITSILHQQTTSGWIVPSSSLGLYNTNARVSTFRPFFQFFAADNTNNNSNSSNRRIDVQIHHQINIKRQKQQQGSWGLAASSEDEDGSDDE
jgi:lipase chaperone LimK